MAEKIIDSATLKARVSELEASLDEARAAIAAAEESLTTAFAEGRDPKSAQTALQAARQNLTDRIAVLSKLENRWYGQVMAERRAAQDAIAKETQEIYQGIVTALVDALEGAVAPILAKADIPATALADFTESAKNELWEAVQIKMADKVQALGPDPAEPKVRAADGRHVDLTAVSRDQRDKMVRDARILSAIEPADPFSEPSARLGSEVFG